MAFDTNRGYMSRSQAEAALYDAGLRAYMLRVYNYMVGALGVTGITAYLVSQSPELINLFFATPLKWVILFAPLIVAWFVLPRVLTMSKGAAQATFWAFAALMGISLATIFLVYTGASITRVFFITAAAFAGLSLFGYTTKRNLSAFGTFLMMGLFGIIIASIVNIFLQSAMMQFVVSVIGVLVFAGLTAWNTQQIKEMYFDGDEGEAGTGKAIFAASILYMSFINMFLFLLQLFGNRE